jgi:anti-sigma-K factor RskA
MRNLPKAEVKIMDKLAKRLREDAERIDATISPELDARIDASLRAVTPARPADERRPARSWTFWLASSLTGAAAAIVLLVGLNMGDAPVETPPVVANSTIPNIVEVPVFDLHAETAVLTSPLSEELEALQSDLRKAEEKLREDIGL